MSEGFNNYAKFETEWEESSCIIIRILKTLKGKEPKDF